MNALKAAILCLVLLGCGAVKQSPSISGTFASENGPTLTLNDDRSYSLTWGSDSISGNWSQSGIQITLNPEKINGKDLESVIAGGTRSIAETGQAPAENPKVAVAQWQLSVSTSDNTLYVLKPIPPDLGLQKPAEFKKK